MDRPNHSKIKPKNNQCSWCNTYSKERALSQPNVIALLDRANFNKFQTSFTFFGIYMDKISPYI